MILDMLDTRRENESQVHVVKAALAGNDPARLTQLFPQWFPEHLVDEDTDEGQVELARGGVEDYRDVKFFSPKDAGSNPEVDELLRLQEALFANQHISVSQNSDGGWQ